MRTKRNVEFSFAAVCLQGRLSSSDFFPNFDLADFALITFPPLKDMYRRGQPAS